MLLGQVAKSVTLMKVIVLVIFITLLAGCDSVYLGSTVQECKEQGYKGIVLKVSDKNPEISCSDGEVSPINGYKTDSGNKALKQNNFRAAGSTVLYTYIKF